MGLNPHWSCFRGDPMKSTRCRAIMTKANFTDFTVLLWPSQHRKRNLGIFCSILKRTAIQELDLWMTSWMVIYLSDWISLKLSTHPTTVERVSMLWVPSVKICHLVGPWNHAFSMAVPPYGKNEVIWNWLCGIPGDDSVLDFCFDFIVYDFTVTGFYCFCEPHRLVFKMSGHTKLLNK